METEKINFSEVREARETKVLDFPISVSPADYDKLLHTAYVEKISIKDILEQLIEAFGKRIPAPEMSSIELDISDSDKEFLRTRAKTEGLTIDEFIMRTLLEQMGADAQEEV